MTREIWHAVRGAELREGDVIAIGTTVQRVDRLVPYRHPVIAPEPGARVAYWKVDGGEQGLTIFPDAEVIVMDFA